MPENQKADYESNQPLLTYVSHSLESELRDFLADLDVPFRVAFTVLTAQQFWIKASELELGNPLVELEGQVTGVILVADANAIRHVEKEVRESLSVVEAKWEGEASDIRRLFCVIPPQAKPPGWDANESLPRTFELEIRSTDDLPAVAPSTVSIPISYHESNVPPRMYSNEEGSDVAGAKRFDVFLAHNSKDKPEIRLLADALVSKGIKPWIDADEIAPGQSFQDAIQQAIQNVRAIAICVGRGGLGKWQGLELKAAISKCVDSGIPVVPVLLPEVEHLPSSLLFLRELNWVKFEAHTQEETQILRLIWGIRGTKPSELGNAEVSEQETSKFTVQCTQSGQPGRSSGVVFGLHGIRTHAGWHRALYEVLTNEAWQVRTDRWFFGSFSLLQFLTPWARSAKVKWFRKAYDDETKDRRVRHSEREYPSIVAHSFGTFILGNAMLKYDWLRFDKIILCGSILPVDFPWDKLIERGQVQSVRNEHGVKDIWVRLVGWVVADTGPSGHKGFICTHERLDQEEFYYDHSEYFDSGHIEAKWLPFLQKSLDTIPSNSFSVPRPKTTRPWLLYIGYFIAIAAFAFVGWRIAFNQKKVGVLESKITESEQTKLPRPDEEKVTAVDHSLHEESERFDTEEHRSGTTNLAAEAPETESREDTEANRPFFVGVNAVGEWRCTNDKPDTAMIVKPISIISQFTKAFAEGDVDMILGKDGPTGCFLWAHLHAIHPDMHEASEGSIGRFACCLCCACRSRILTDAKLSPHR
jgi:hypothetical protein